MGLGESRQKYLYIPYPKPTLYLQLLVKSLDLSVV